MTAALAEPASPPDSAVTEQMQILRGEPFGGEHLEQHARQLAASLRPIHNPPKDREFSPRFAANAGFLRTAHQAVSAAIRSGEPLTTDAEWLLDNFYIVEEHLREIQDDLPQRYYQELPKLASGQPRVYVLALELIIHTDSALDEETIFRYVHAIQSVAPLSIGEVWAVPIMLRLALVENLRRLIAQLLERRRCREQAREVLAAWRDHEQLPLDFSSLEKCAPVVIELLDQLQEEGAAAPAAIRRLEEQLAQREWTTQQLAHVEHQRQAANQVSIGNVITSMRLISALDWVVFFERINVAEQVLRQDPSGVYPQMDFESRDRYRHAVEQLAKRTSLADDEVARRVVALSARAAGQATTAVEQPQQHIGYWLVDRGREAFEAEIGYRAPFRQQLQRFVLRHPNVVYLGGIASLTALAALMVALLAWACGAPEWTTALLSLLAILPASEGAVSIVNLIVTSWLQPRLLPKLEFKEEIPARYATFVVVPSMLTSPRDVQSLLERLETHYLANPDPALRFALLTDYADADEEELPTDGDLLAQAVQGIRDLNARYAADGRGPFYLFHRCRRWNDVEGRWMGWERKRGKLMEFNRLIQGAQDTSYVVQEGDLAALIESQNAVRFIITLDADTQLPYGTARKLIGTLAHPLNRPHYDPVRRRVVSGYGIVQPRLSVHLASANRTWFSRIFANNPGVDPYTTSASDVYQDLFGEGSFTGKGIYDLEAVERALADAFPENQILSHDLIEGCFARVALASDIEVVDGFPGRYDADARRQHRWVRGDWQIMPWLLPRIPSAAGWRSNPLTLLSRWKIFDNLRRSLVSPALLTFLFVGWLVFPAAAWLWTLLGLVVLTFPLLTQIALALRGWPRAIAFGQQIQTVLRDWKRSLLQTLLITALLPYHAISMLDAIVRTLWRMLLSRRKLLEWETADATERRLSQGRWSTLWQMWYVPVLAVAIWFVLPLSAWPAAAPLLVLWAVSPLVAHFISQPIPIRVTSLTPEQSQSLRITARKMWAFYETYVGPDDHWLPPDNVQEYPGEKIAHRVSPTNEGLVLASALVARDLGYIGLFSLVQFWERNLANWTKLPRLHGHFYNWYDTLTLEPLRPRYVSTVDSGNLAACFLTLHQGIAELRAAPVFSPALWQGLLDTVEVAQHACESLHPRGARLVSPPLDNLTDAIVAIRRHGTESPRSPWAWNTALEQLGQDADLLRQRLDAFIFSGAFPETDLTPKVQALTRWIEGMREDWRSLFPWVGVAATICGPQASRGNHEAPAFPWSAASPDVARHWALLWQKLAAIQTLAAAKDLDASCEEHLSAICSALASETGEADRAAALAWCSSLSAALRSGAQAARLLDGRCEQLAQRMQTLALEMDFRFLYNKQRRLFAIGYNLEEGMLDRSHYDMLCSEARLASYLAIAKGDAEPRHWFQLSRPVTQTAGQVALLSWGGTMFEYLMPPLFQINYAGSLLTESCQAAVARQQEYGRQQGVPWGVSESAFGALAVNSDYHYRSFGVPGLGLKRGLGKDLVVSPYSTMLALAVDPAGAYENLLALQRDGGFGPWGPYDAIDYTPQRVPAGKRAIVVRCYMAHHQGMSLLAIANLLHKGSIRRRFHAHPLSRASELLLQERVPLATPRMVPHADELASVEVPRIDEELVSRRLLGVETPAPRTQLLANGQYSVMLTSTGGGYSRWRDVAVTRWRPDTTLDPWGQFIYLRDLGTQRMWSATYQPTCAPPDRYEVVFSIDKAEYHRRDGDLETHLEVAVSPENNAEVRQLKITNHGSQTKRIEITSYAEVVLNQQAADVAHPAFHKLFIETEYIPEETALLAHRRPRDARQTSLWGLHVLSCPSARGEVEYESSRQAFLGRGRTVQQPAALDPRARLTGQVGAVLDPVFALRCIVEVPPQESVVVGLTTAIATSRDEALALADQYHEFRSVLRAFELAWAYNQVQLRHLHLSPAKAHLYQRLAAAVLYPDPVRRGAEELLLANRQGQSGLWRYGVSGDLPIVLMHVTKPEHMGHVRELLAAHTYWQSHGLEADLVILNDYPGSYLDELQEQLVALLNEVPRPPDHRPAGVYLLRAAHLPLEDKALLEAAASVVFHGDRGSIGQQWEAASRSAPASRERKEKLAVGAAPARSRPAASSSMPASRQAPHADAARIANSAGEDIEQLEFWNGLGGFALEGREYRIRLRKGAQTPMPWANVIANSAFGTLVTESGSGYTWAANSRESKLTTWSNDPTSDPPSEALYIRDDATGELWSPLPGILRDGGDYWIHHGQGYSRFIHSAVGIDHEVLVSIAPDDPVKFICVTLRNTTNTPRELSLTYFVEWVLGVSREQTQLSVQTEIHAATGALLARNRYRNELAEQVAFLQVLGGNKSCTGDRREFLGRNGSRLRPKALLDGDVLSGRTGPGMDPCGAVQTKITLPERGSLEVVFLLGAGVNAAQTDALLARFADLRAVHQAMEETAARWDDVLGAVQVKTPNRALDLLVNRWLLYQTLSCRVWGRSALYQSGGAYGFRDQLQDVMALVYSRPDLAREHLLRAAARQFEEGDVQHWWHPPEGRGTRTRFSDDLLWLPLVVAHYVRITGDVAILDSEVPFLISPPLEQHEHERYELPSVSANKASLYEHCRRAIARGLRTGPHGLPLMGCGDWNDGMNRVGELGRGESVWVGWFLLVILRDFIPLMQARGDSDAAQELAMHADALRASIERHAWDGQWYRRAFFDDGTPLGSSQNDECQIDSIAQTWAVFADADPERTRQAMQAVLERLVRRDERLVLLFAPPFDRTALDPGYIKGYLPGIRENGGQYTHPALWLIQALAKMGRPEEALAIYDLINPIHHAESPQDVARYQVEPYVVAADVYGVPPQTGRGGWTWYTGSAAWMYRAALESLLGFEQEGNRLRIQPRIPASWPGFEITLRRNGTTWRLNLLPSSDETTAMPAEVELVEDGGTHEIELEYFRPAANFAPRVDEGSLEPANRSS